MAGGKGGKTKKRNSRDSTASQGSDERKGGGNKAAASAAARKKIGSAKSGKSSKFQGDIFNEGAMEHAYIVCHNVQDLLKCRGFPWPEAAKKKKKGKKK